MEKRGLLEGTLEPAPGQGPPRKTYRLTDRGRDHLVRAALSCLSGPTEERSSIETALENIRLINPHTALAALGLYAESLEAERAEKGPAEDDPDLEAVVLAERRRRRIAAEIGFVEWLSATIRDHLDDEGRGWKR
jgi:DNA-binding PadR family transcriptional regulator